MESEITFLDDTWADFKDSATMGYMYQGAFMTGIGVTPALPFKTGSIRPQLDGEGLGLDLNDSIPSLFSTSAYLHRRVIVEDT